MTQFIESLYRLYRSNKLNKHQLDKLLEHHKINQQEYDYIVSAKKVV